MEVASNPEAPPREERVRQVRIGLVGAGAQMLDCLYPALLSLEDVAICGVCDVVQDRAASLAGHISTAESFAEIGKMVAQTAPDLLIAACPPEGHEEVLWAALADGLPTFVEKPPARSLDSLKELSSAIVAKNLATGVGMNFRYATPYLAFKKLLDSGEHGRPVSVTVTHVANKPRSSLWGYDLLWSVLLAQSVHPVNLVLDLIGKAERIESVKERIGDRLFLGTQLRGSSGALGTVVVATGAQRFHFSIHVVTDLGAVLTSTDLMDVVLRPADTGEQGAKVVWNASPLDRGHRRTGYASELGSLCDAVRHGRPFSPDVPSLIPTYEVLTEVARGEC